MIRLIDEVEERIEQEKIESMKPDLVQRIQHISGKGCPLLADTSDTPVLAHEIVYYGENWLERGACILSDGERRHCYAVNGNTQAQEICPLYHRVLEQLGL